MSDLLELKAERERKLSRLVSMGVDCFPAKITLPGERILSTMAKNNLDESRNLEDVLLAGRIMTIRGQGKILFVDLQDGAGKFQIVLKVDILGEDKMNLFFDNIDTGDFVAFSGNLFVTQRGEKSLEAYDYQILTKTVLPIPSTFYGLENEEEKLRKRYLSILLEPELKDRFIRKAKFWKTVRGFLEERGFVEVETPTIETTTGGAEARPFKTYHNDYDLDVFMRIDIGELWQKRLLAAGFEKTYQIGKAYRNEGSSPTHLQEFTNCEFYWAYSEYREGMQMIKELYRKIASEVYGRTKFTIGAHTFDLSDDWGEINYVDEIKNRTGLDVFTATEEELKDKLKELGVVWDGDGKERLTDTLWKYCRKQISGPAFLINHPAYMSALSKHNPNGLTSQVFQPIIAGAEAGKGFSELNDYRVQSANFQRQRELLEAGDEEAMMPDFSFVEMLEHGMPPAFGYGFGERLFAFFEGVPIREVQMFPLIRPKDELKINKKEIKVATIILNKEYNLEKWQELNAAAHLGAGFAGNIGKELFYKKEIMTKDGKGISLNIQHAIIVKQAKNKNQIFNLMDNAQKEGIRIYSFTKEMLETSNDKKVEEITKSKDYEDIDFLGVLIFGNRNDVDNLTKEFELHN